MLELDSYTEEVHNAFITHILPNLVKRIKKGRTHNKKHVELTDGVKDILLSDWRSDKPKDTEILKKLLVREPTSLAKLNKEINDRIGALPKADRSTNKDIELIFNYEDVFSNNKENSYWLAKIIGRNTCTYCNRQYIFTIEYVDDNKKTLQVARPEFDHWWSKSDFPLLSLSLYNLIPSCKICNSSVKGEDKFNLSSHIHPYIKENVNSKFTFRAVPKTSSGLKWRVKIERKEGTKIDNTIKAFALDEIYSMHEPLEVKDIMDFYDAYPEGYVNSLIHKLCTDSNYAISRTDAYRILFGTELSTNKYLDRPFSKLKHDLLQQIGLNLDSMPTHFY